MITDPTSINPFCNNLEHVRVPRINDETTIPEVQDELEREQFHQHSGCPKLCVSDNGAWTLVDSFESFPNSLPN